MVATSSSSSCRRPASATPSATPSPASNNRSSNSPPSSNTLPVPFPSVAPTSPHSYFPPPPSIKLRPDSSSQSSQPVSPSSSTASISSLNRASSGSQRSSSPQSFRTKSTGANNISQKPNQFILLHGRPHSPSTLTSSLAPPSLIPMTAAGISASAKGSRKSPAGMKLSLPSIPPASSPGPSMTPTYTLSSHHHQAYSHSLSAQQQLQLHQKEIIHQATRATGIPQHLLSTGPMSPRLIPLGSPGPVTPLTLEDGPDGFFASGHGFGHQQLSQQLSVVASGQRGL